jgi:hypothetical protein
MAAEPPMPAAEVAAATQPDKIATLLDISKAKQKLRILVRHIIICYLGCLSYLFFKKMSIQFNIINMLQTFIYLI